MMMTSDLSGFKTMLLDRIMSGETVSEWVSEIWYVSWIAGGRKRSAWCWCRQRTDGAEHWMNGRYRKVGIYKKRAEAPGLIPGNTKGGQSTCRWMPVNINRLLTTYEVRLKPRVDGVSEAKTSIVVTAEDKVKRFLGIICRAGVHVNKPLYIVQETWHLWSIWCMITIYISSFITTDEASLVGYTVAWPFGHVPW